MSRDRSGRRGRTLAVLLGLSVSALFLWLAFRGTDLRALVAHARGASVPVLSLVLLTKGAALTMATLRSNVLLKALHPFGSWRVMKSLMVAFVGNAVLPLRAGEVMRIAYLAKHSEGNAPPTSCVAVVVVERVVDAILLLVLLAIVVTAGIVTRPDGVAFWAAAAVVLALGGLMALLVLRPERVRGLFARSAFLSAKVGRFSDGLRALAGSGSLAAVLAASVGYWAFQALGVRVWFWAFGMDLPWYAPLVVLVFIAFGAALPSSPGYVGTYHFFAVSALMLMGADRVAAASVATVGHFLAIVPLTVVSLAVLFREFVGRRSPEDDTPGEHLSVHYRQKALPRTFTRRILRAQQDRIYERYERAFPPREGERILDLGVDGSLEHPHDYFFEHAYPYPSQITAAGLEEPTQFGECYPEIEYIQVSRDQGLPFADGAFDVVFCSAVIEHVGTREDQRRFLQEVLRVGRAAFVTTPNRWYPVDLHTVIPLLHWLPGPMYRPLYRALGFEFFSREENLNLLDRRALLDIAREYREVRVGRHWFLGFPSNLLLSVQR